MGRPPVSLLLTRPAGQNRRFLALLSPRCRDGVVPICTPLIGIEPLFQPDLPPVKAAIFTSANAVRFGPAGGGRVAYCVGAATTRAACDAGWAGQMAGENADALVARLIAAQPQALTHLRGVHSRGDVAGRLRKAGHDVTEAVLYDQVLLPLAAMARQALNAQHRCVVPLFSPRAAAHFMQIAPGADVEVAALSPAVADVLAGGGAPVAIADRPDIGSMAQLVEKLIVNGPAG